MPQVNVRIRSQQGYFIDATQPFGKPRQLRGGEILKFERTPRLSKFTSSGFLEEIGENSPELEKHKEIEQTRKDLNIQHKKDADTNPRNSNKVILELQAKLADLALQVAKNGNKENKKADTKSPQE